MTRQFSIGKPLAGHLAHRQMEPVRIIQRIILRSAIVETEDLLCDVAIKMEGLNCNIGAAQTALQQAPEVIDALSVDFAPNVFFNVVDRRVDIIPSAEVVIDWSAVGVNRGTAFNLIEDFIQKSLALYIWNHLGANLTALPVQHSHDYRCGVFAIRAMNFQTTRAVHLLRLWAYMSLIHFNWTAIIAAHLQEAARLHGLPDAVKHEPCRLLGDANVFGQFIAADAILAGCQHPDGGHPLVHPDRGILKDRPDFHRELLLAAVAEPYPAGLQERVRVRSAAGTIDPAIGPAKLHSIAKSAFRVGEVNYCLLKGYRSFESVGHRALHKNSLRLMFSCVKYVIPGI